MNSKKPIRIYFCSPTGATDDVIYGCTIFNTVPLYLNSYIKTIDKNLYDKIEWVKIDFSRRSQQELVAMIKESDANVVCFSLYFWNKDLIKSITANIKALLPEDILILAGGPAVNPVRDSTYVDNNPDFDFIVYSQGEKPFYDILKHKFENKKFNVLTTKNCAWKDKNTGKVKLANYELYRDSKGSPYLESEDLLKQVISDPEYIGMNFSFPYETARGCPYNCSFCDWTSGLTHKVTKRKTNYELELDMFDRLGLHYLCLADANFGLFKEDKPIMEYLGKLNQANGFKFKTISTNYSKTHKDRVYEILEIAIENKIISNAKISVQDIHTFILDNIERPDIPWEDQLKYIFKLKEKFPDITVTIELIQGLPGQTRDTWETTLREISKHGFISLVFKFTEIPNSPASYDTEWRQRMQVKTTNMKLEWNSFGDAITESYSFTNSDYGYFNFLTEVYGILQKISGDAIYEFGQVIDLIKSSNKYPEFLQQVETNYSNLLKTKILCQEIVLETMFKHRKLFGEKFNKILPKLIELKSYSAEISKSLSK